MRHKKDKIGYKHKKDSQICKEVSLSKKIKAIQLTTVVILLVAAFYLGKISMTKQISGSYDRINQLEMQIDQIQKDKKNDKKIMKINVKYTNLC